MNKIYSPLFLGIFLACFSLSLKAQIGRSLYAGTSISSFRDEKMKSKGGARYEFGYTVFAKYSSRLEWSSSIGFSAIKRADVPVFKSDYGSSQMSDYTPTKTDLNSSLLTFAYTLSYYVIPDQLAVFGGLDLGFDFISNMRRMTSSKYDNLFFVKQVADGNNSPYLLSVPVSEIKTPWVSYGPTLGLSYTYDERFMVFARYTLYMNKYFSSENREYLDESKLNLLRIGFAYKFIPSGKDRRF